MNQSFAGNSMRTLVVVAAMALASTAAGQSQPWDTGAGPDFGAGPEESDPLSVAAQFTAPTAARPAQLYVTVTLQPGWHIYSVTQPKPYVATRISLSGSSACKTTGEFGCDPLPTRRTEADGTATENHAGTVTWHVPIKLPPNVDPAALKIEGKLNAQACGPRGCDMPRDYPFTATLGKGVAVAAPGPPPAKAVRSAAAKASPRVSVPDKAASPGPSSP
jgi:DsbC/DsbD-like thiol-disulfide interchange protein